MKGGGNITSLYTDSSFLGGQCQDKVEHWVSMEEKLQPVSLASCLSNHHYSITFHVSYQLDVIFLCCILCVHVCVYVCVHVCARACARNCTFPGNFIHFCHLLWRGFHSQNIFRVFLAHLSWVFFHMLIYWYFNLNIWLTLFKTLRKTAPGLEQMNWRRMSTELTTFIFGKT